MIRDWCGDGPNQRCGVRQSDDVQVNGSFRDLGGVADIKRLEFLYKRTICHDTSVKSRNFVSLDDTL
jgi:hypothetical protein